MSNSRTTLFFQSLGFLFSEAILDHLCTKSESEFNFQKGKMQFGVSFMSCHLVPFIFLRQTCQYPYNYFGKLTLIVAHSETDTIMSHQ